MTKKLQSCLNKVIEWEISNNMEFNKDKFKSNYYNMVEWKT